MSSQREFAPVEVPPPCEGEHSRTAVLRNNHLTGQLEARCSRCDALLWFVTYEFMALHDDWPWLMQERTGVTAVALMAAVKR